MRSSCSRHAGSCSSDVRFQEHVDNAVSKTVNLPANATVAEADKAYQMVFKLGCKGITVYRDVCSSSRPSTEAAAKQAGIMCNLPANPASSSLAKGSQAGAKGWLAIQEVADLLNISRDTVERWINAGYLRAVDVSARNSSCRRRTWRISYECLERFLETRANRVPTPERTTPRRKKPDVIEFIK